MIKIAVISDAHLGYAYGSEKEDDSYAQFEEALNIALYEKVDLILLAGDIFDSRIPRQEVWAKALKIFQKPLLAEKNHLKLTQTLNRKEDFSKMIFNGIPTVAIYGTHERRGEGFVNPVQILEKGGYLILLDKSGVVLEKEGEKIAIQGLSGTPERFVKEALQNWNPKPIEGCKNIFIFHQSLKEYIYDPENTFLSLNDLPPGFDLYIDGHIHWSNVLADNKKVLFPGSTVITQQKRTEEEKKKGMFIIEINGGVKNRFVELKTQRPFFYRELEFKDASVSEVIEKSRRAVSEIMSKEPDRKPLIKLKLKGTLEKGKKVGNISTGEIKKDYEAMISIDKEIQSEDFAKKIEDLRKLQQEKKSVEERGMELVQKMLKETKYSGINPEEVINPLSEGNSDAVIRKVLENFKKKA